jgi:hypothetical protein
MIEWDSYKHIPRMLYCGHTICEICLCNILESNLRVQKEFFCPSCMTSHLNIKTIDDIKNLIKNISLLRICEKMELRRSILSSSITSSRNNLDISLHSSFRNLNKNSNKNYEKNYNNNYNNNIDDLMIKNRVGVNPFMKNKVILYF